MVGNRSFENEKEGILIQGGARPDQPNTGRGFLVTGNVCSHNKLRGIRAYYMNGAMINANYCRCNEAAGIRLDGNTRNIMVNGNLIATSAGVPAIDDDGTNFVANNQTFQDGEC